MLARLQAVWEEVVTGLWLVPSLMALAAVGLAWVTANVPLDQFNPSENWWLSSGDSQSVTALLSALLMSMITLATLAISITMVVLTLAAGSMGPRLIRNFMADKRSQLMLGYFLATVIYLILILRAVHDAGDDENVHHLAATASTVLSIGCIFFLLLFVHHLSRSIIADTVIQWVGERLDLTLEEMPTLREVEEILNDPAFDRERAQLLSVQEEENTLVQTNKVDEQEQVIQSDHGAEEDETRA